MTKIMANSKAIKKLKYILSIEKTKLNKEKFKDLKSRQPHVTMRLNRKLYIPLKVKNQRSFSFPKNTH